MKNHEGFKTARDPLIKKVLKTIEKFNMLKPGDRVLISISGGPDSTLLAHLFFWLKPEFKLILYGFCLDHLTRNGESTRDLLFVEELCNNLKIPLSKKTIDAANWCRERGLSFQEGARILRIGMLEEIARDKRIDRIAVGHNADDNMETFLMRILRGAGSKGLAGIKPISGKIIRPLIEIPREGIEKFLERENIPFCLDRTNTSNVYFRNKIRNSLIPYIERNFSGAFKKNITRVTDILRTEDEFLENYTVKVFRKISIFPGSSKNRKIIYLKIPISGFGCLHAAIKRRVIIEAVQALKGDKINLKFRNIEDLIRIAENSGGENKTVEVFKDLKAVKAGEFIYFFNLEHKTKLPEELSMILDGVRSRIVAVSENQEQIEEIKIDGKTILSGFNFILQSKIIDIRISGTKVSEEENTKMKIPKTKSPEGRSIKLDFKKAESFEAYIDYGSLKLPLAVRTWKAGDRFVPLGMSNEKKIHDFFIDNKIPAQMRKSIPIFFDREKIVWIGNFRIDQRVKINMDTKKILYMKLFEK